MSQDTKSAKPHRGSCLARTLKWGGALLVLALSLIAVAIWIASEPRPVGQADERAGQLARRMLLAVNHDAWLATGAVRWTFRGVHEHLWDRDRHLARVRWGDTEVQVDLTTRTGVALEKGKRLSGDREKGLLERAWRLWANDSFWLNPVSKIFDPGTSRMLVERQNDQPALLVTYDQGGVTPGDAYLWELDNTGLPVSWKMWVSIIPIGGLEASWEDWTTLSTGVRVAQNHRVGPLRIELTDIEARATLAELEPGVDPFVLLLNNR